MDDTYLIDRIGVNILGFDLRFDHCERGHEFESMSLYHDVIVIRVD